MNFPESLKAREQYIFDQVLAGNFDAEWVPIEYSAGGRTIKMNVMGDALKVDGIRVNVSAEFQQKLADVFDASLLTAQVVDLMYLKATKRPSPQPMPISSSVASMIKHSQSVDLAVGNLSPGDLVAPVGKHWILDKRLESFSNQNPARACTYGWHFVGTNYKGIAGYSVASPLNSLGPSQRVSVIQQNTCGHDLFHSDYSQICQLVSQTCWVNGDEKRFSDLLQDPVLSYLVSSSGVTKITRQPGTVSHTGTIVIFPVKIVANEGTGVA
jgi:hypothetical protein